MIMTAALHANSVFSDDKNSQVKSEMIEKMEQDFDDAVRVIYGGKSFDEIPTDDPLFTNITPLGTD